MDHPALQRRWRERFGSAPPHRSKSDFLRRALAYEAQASVYGGVTAVTRRKMRSAPKPTLRCKPGTRLVREWQGEMHVVTVVPDGFEYRGERHRSLSVIARHITGTRWSGPLFFGLRDR